MPRLRVLLLVAAPDDVGRSDREMAATIIVTALEPLTRDARISLQRVAPATENSLRRLLKEGQWDILHFVGHSHSRDAARYSTVMFEASDRRARGVNADYLARLITAHPSLRLVIFQPIVEEVNDRTSLATTLVQFGVPGVVLMPPLPAPRQSAHVAAFYNILSATGDIESAVRTARARPLAAEGDSYDFSLHMRDASDRFFAAPQNVASATVAPPTMVDPTITKPAAEPDMAAVEVARKRASGAFDVFLCHNSSDKPAVKQVAEWLKGRGILPWLDEWELPPGQPWRPLLEEQIGSIKSAAVFFGPSGVSPWQDQEFDALLREFVDRRSPVIPVLLPDAPELPRFLRAFTWVDFRQQVPDPLGRLIWGITRKRMDD